MFRGAATLGGAPHSSRLWSGYDGQRAATSYWPEMTEFEVKDQETTKNAGFKEHDHRHPVLASPFDEMSSPAIGTGAFGKVLLDR